MKKTCVIHIGLHKTGSSSIQSSLHKNREILKSEFDINYYGKQPNHGTIFTLFSENIKHYRHLKHLRLTDEGGIDRFKSDLKTHLNHALKSNTSPYFVLSGEDLSFLEGQEVKSLYEFLKPFFDSFQIYAYVRDPMSYANSIGQQHVKAGMTFSDIKQQTFDLDPNHEVPISLPGSVYPFYRARIEPYQTVFGTDNVEISNFSAIHEGGEDVCTHFMEQAFGITGLPQSFEILRVNESLASDAVYLAEALNNEIPVFVNNTLNQKRAHSLILQLFSLKSEASFVLPEFDFTALARIVESDVTWLKTVTDDRIDFTDMKPPEKSAYLWPDLAPIAQFINKSLLNQEENVVRKDIFRTLWLCSQNPEAARKSIDCKNLVNRCNDAKALANFSYSLKGIGFLDFALPAVNRAILLSKDTSDRDFYNRLILMKSKILESK